jgi:hypothetical protein
MQGQPRQVVVQAQQRPHAQPRQVVVQAQPRPDPTTVATSTSPTLYSNQEVEYETTSTGDDVDLNAFLDEAYASAANTNDEPEPSLPVTEKSGKTGREADLKKEAGDVRRFSAHASRVIEDPNSVSSQVLNKLKVCFL